jgi:hypothetical protein
LYAWTLFLQVKKLPSSDWQTGHLTGLFEMRWYNASNSPVTLLMPPLPRVWEYEDAEAEPARVTVPILFFKFPLKREKINYRLGEWIVHRSAEQGEEKK